MSNEMIPATAEEVKEPSQLADRHESSNNYGNVFGNEADFEKAIRFAKPLAQSDLVPLPYKGNIANCIIALDIANRMGLSPLMVMQNLYIVKGKPSWSGQACRALIENGGRFKNTQVVYIGEKNQDSWGCYLEAEDLKTGKIVTGPTVDIAMVKREGWYSKKSKEGVETSKWQTMPELMLAYRAAAFFARVHCPSVMMGFQTTEEISDVAHAEKNRRINSITSDILEG